MTAEEKRLVRLVVAHLDTHWMPWPVADAVRKLRELVKPKKEKR